MSGTLFEKAFETNDIAVVILNADGTIVEANPATAALLDQPKQAIIGMPVSGIIPGASVGDLNARLNADDTPAVLRDLSAVTQSGRLFPITINLTQWTHNGGVHYTLMLRDIEEELANQHAAQRESLRTSNALQAARIGVFEYDVRTEKLIVSDIWRELFGMLPDDDATLEEVWTDSVHPDDLDIALSPAVACIEDGLYHMSADYRIYTRDRSAVRWMRNEVTVAAYDADGTVLRLVGSEQDITDHKEAERALAESVEQFHSAFELAPIGKAILGLDVRWNDINAAFCAFLGHDRDTLMTMEPRQIVHPDDIDEELLSIAAMIRGEQDIHVTKKRYLHASGKVIWGQGSMTLVRNANGAPKHILIQIIDITREQDLLQGKSTFLSAIAHELRTPMTSLQGGLSLLAERPETELSEASTKLVNICTENATRLNQLMIDLLEYERLSEGHIALEKSEKSLTNLVARALAQQEPSAAVREIALATNLPGTQAICTFDSARLTQVVSSLIANVVRFSSPGSTVDVSLTEEPEHIRVTIQSAGLVLPDGLAQNIFAPFAHPGPETKGGTGLGLSIAKLIIRQSGGDIGFDTPADGDAGFWFTLPRAVSEPAVAQSAVA